MGCERGCALEKHETIWYTDMICVYPMTTKILKKNASHTAPRALHTEDIVTELAKISRKLKKLDVIAREEKRVEQEEKRVERQEKAVRKEERVIEKAEKRIEKKMDTVGKEEKNIERVLLTVGKVKIRKKHFLELIRASAGAFLGVGLGKSLLGLDSTAGALSWWNVMGIFVFVCVVSALMIYKKHRETVQKKGYAVVWQNLLFMYCISLIIEAFSLFLFGYHVTSALLLAKVLILGSFAAMGSAVTFSLMD